MISLPIISHSNIVIYRSKINKTIKGKEGKQDLKVESVQLGKILD